MHLKFRFFFFHKNQLPIKVKIPPLIKWFLSLFKPWLWPHSVTKPRHRHPLLKSTEYPYRGQHEKCVFSLQHFLHLDKNLSQKKGTGTIHYSEMVLSLKSQACVTKVWNVSWEMTSFNNSFAWYCLEDIVILCFKIEKITKSLLINVKCLAGNIFLFFLYTFGFGFHSDFVTSWLKSGFPKICLLFTSVALEFLQFRFESQVAILHLNAPLPHLRNFETWKLC